MSERILSVLVEDKPGVLARISSTISRRGFNINSLSVGPTNIEGRSKMTIVTELESVEQVKKQLNKLINVIKIVELDPDNTCLLYTSPSPRDVEESRMPSSA